MKISNLSKIVKMFEENEDCKLINITDIRIVKIKNEESGKDMTLVKLHGYMPRIRDGRAYKFRVPLVVGFDKENPLCEEFTAA